ncbi:MAG: hypothetical protein HOE90_10535 [Bacteriovoracaceae bacterium]|jgi:hypothetical protein|nr:hypothetical protein [Bacteriovoracaceae bacterium]
MGHYFTILLTIFPTLLWAQRPYAQTPRFSIFSLEAQTRFGVNNQNLIIKSFNDHDVITKLVHKRAQKKTTYYYDQIGRLKKREVDINGDGRHEIITRFEESITTYLRSVSQKAFRKKYIWKKNSTSSVTKEEYTVKKIGRNEILTSKQTTTPAMYLSQEQDADCPPAEDTPEIEMNIEGIIENLDQSVEVSPRCSKFEYRQADGEKKTYSDVEIKQVVTATLQEGLKCMTDLGGDAADMVISSFVESFGKGPLKIDCDPIDGYRCSKYGDPLSQFCGRASNYTEQRFPALDFNSNCESKIGNLDTVVFHEFLHLGSNHTGEQNLHHYDQSDSMEKVEICAKYCFYNELQQGDGAQRKSDYGSLCRGDFNEDPKKHHLAFAMLEFNQSNPLVVKNELEKVVATDPENWQAWSMLIHTYKEEAALTSNNFNRMAILGKLIMALEKTRDLPIPEDLVFEQYYPTLSVKMYKDQQIHIAEDTIEDLSNRLGLLKIPSEMISPLNRSLSSFGYFTILRDRCESYAVIADPDNLPAARCYSELMSAREELSIGARELFQKNVDESLGLEPTLLNELSQAIEEDMDDFEIKGTDDTNLIPVFSSHLPKGAALMIKAMDLTAAHITNCFMKSNPKSMCIATPPVAEMDPRFICTEERIHPE